MKKLILIFLSILIGLYLILSLFSLRDNYSAERELWALNHQLFYYSSREESTPDYKINQILHRYTSFINKYQGTSYASQAQLMLGNFYAAQKNYTQARLEYQKVMGKDQELSAEAQINIAKTYEAEDQWDKAQSIYKSVIHDYPLTNSGFLVPIYLANHAAESQDQDYLAAYREAENFYQNAASQHPKSKIEYNALKMVAVCQLNQKDWSGTVKTMGKIMLTYPTGKILQESVSAINVLCVTKLHDYDAAVGIYKSFIQKYPDYPSDKVLNKMINSLEMLKSKNFIIQPVQPVAPHGA